MSEYKVIFCKRCLNANTRPNIKFGEDGLCPACKYDSQVRDIDWSERDKEIKPIVEFGKKNNKSGYDCIVGVSGGKDSTRQALYVKEHLGMNPLLVSMNYPPEQMSQRGANNISNLIKLGFDCINITCSPKIWKKLMRQGLYEYGNWAKSTELALFSSVPRLAIAYQIPLIWWGENAATVLGDSGVQGKSGADGNRLKYSNTLAGGDISWILKNEIKRNQILQYCYPPDEDMEKAGLRIFFLGHFWKDFTMVDNGNFASLRGLHIRDESPDDIGAYLGVSMLDEDFIPVNMMIKYLKFGFGWNNDQVNEEIRNGRMTREFAIKLVERYDGKCSDKIIKRFCDYIEISVEEFWRVVDGYVNKALFEKDSNGKWVRNFKIGQPWI